MARKKHKYVTNVSLNILFYTVILILNLNVCAWGNFEWQPLGSGMSMSVKCMTVYNGELIAGGQFTAAGGIAVNYIARWNGSIWQPLGSGMNQSVSALKVYNGELIAGGSFTTAGGVSANKIARWNGSIWQPLGSGTNGSVNSLTVYNWELIAGGQFTTAGGVSANHIAYWNGSSWQPLGSGTSHTVWAMTVYNNELIAGGWFNPYGYISCWNGSSWQPLGSKMSDGINDLIVYNEELIAGGYFTTAGGVSANYIARWNGSSWQPLASEVNYYVNALTEYNGELIAGGWFTTAGGISANRIARWNGSSWQSLGSGMNEIVYSLSEYNGQLIAGGYFTTAGGISALRIARWGSTLMVEAGLNQTTDINAVQMDGTVYGASPSVITTWSKVNGPGTVTFDPNEYILDPVAYFSEYGVYVLMLDANDDGLEANDTVIITYKQNDPPVVDAGQDQNGIATATVNLNGSVQDDGLPNPPGCVTVTWSQVSGTGVVTFEPNASVLNPTARFTVFSGSYILKLTANDGQYESNDTVIITYKQNDPPTVNAGQDIVIIETIDGNLVSLNGQVNDDGLPQYPGYVTTTWSKVNGPGTVIFDPNEFVLDPDVSFSEYGVYELMLTADDGEFDANDIVVITYRKNTCDGLLLGDLDTDCDVDFSDLALFVLEWPNPDCSTSECYAADLDDDDNVDAVDYTLLTQNLLKDINYTLSTDDTTIYFSLYPDYVFISSLVNPAESYNWLADNTIITLPTTAWIDTSQYILDWQLQDVNSQTGTDVNTLTITFINQNPSLEAKSIWTAHPGPGPIQHRIEITNTDTQAVQIDYTPSLDLYLTLPQETVKHWWVEKGSHFPTDYGTNITIIDDSFNYTGLCTPYDVSVEEGDNSPRNEPVPWQSIHATASEHGLYTGIESSACITQQVDAQGDANTVKLTLGIDETLSTFRAKLYPSEVYQMPPVFIGCFTGDVDDGSNRLRRWVENWLIPDSDDANLPLLVNDTWCWGVSGAMESKVIAMIDDCNALGIEMCLLDAGWYPKVGDYHKVGYWHPYTTYLPNGIRYVSDYAHSKGVRFGLWSSWTLGCDLTGYGDTVLSINNPAMTDWFSAPGPETPGYWRFTNYNGAVACLNYIPAKNWITADMLRCIRDYDLDHLKHDRRTVAQTCNYLVHHGHLGNSGDISLRNAKAFYEMLDTFRAEGIILESGVMGGRILDYGLMQHCHYTGASDSYTPTLMRRAFYDISHAMPTRVLEAYVSAGQLDDTVASLRYHFRSAMIGWCSLLMDTSTWTSAQWNDALVQFNIYKQKIRPQVRDGNLYHISNRPSSTGWDAYEYYTPAIGEGIIFVFRSESCSNGAPTVFLKGLESAADYDVSFQDGSSSPFTTTGQYLMQTGVMVSLSVAPSSELIYIEKQ